MNVKVDDLAAAIMKELENYSEEITERVKVAVDVVSKEVNEEIKANVTFNERTRKYLKAFRVKTTENTKYNKTNVWHVTGSQYRLTHLLESGHALRGGGRARAFPHIKFGQELAEKRMEELIKEAVADANKS